MTGTVMNDSSCVGQEFSLTLTLVFAILKVLRSVAFVSPVPPVRWQRKASFGFTTPRRCNGYALCAP